MAMIMKIIRTIAQILILYIFQYIGVFIVQITKIPLPPSVVGFILLFICLLMNWIKVEMVRDGASFLIGFMLLFYIPPMIGIIDYPQLISLNGVILIAAVIISTLLTIYITSILTQKIEKREEQSKNKQVTHQVEEDESNVEHYTVHK